MTDRETLERLAMLSVDEDMPEAARTQLRVVLRERDRRGHRDVTAHERALCDAAEEVLRGVGTMADVVTAAALCVGHLADVTAAVS